MPDDRVDEPYHSERAELKVKVARTIKWTVIDKVSVQILYALTGIVLAIKLTHADFGLVGAVLVFQAFGSLFVDSGFASALLQRKSPTQDDYSTVLWFNIFMATALYVILFFAAPLIADCYDGDKRIIPLARVMFLTFIINATSIVQVNRLNKHLEMKKVTIANSAGVFSGAVTGIGMAVTGCGAWSIVGQSLVLSTIKSLVLWYMTSWRPSAVFSFKILRSFFKVGSSVMISSFFNTLYLNIYAFIIGNRVGMVALGYYSQADKWSKIGVSSLGAVVTSSFLPLLSRYQDEPVEYAAVTSKCNRLTAYISIPALGMLAALAPAIFHALFGNKWDGSISLFQLLLLQGVFVVLSGLYTNVILARGKAKLLVVSETVRYIVAAVAIVVTLPYISLSTPTDVTEGIRILLYGQIVASAVFWAIMTVIAANVSGRRWWQMLKDIFPYLIESLLAVWVISLIVNSSLSPKAVIPLALVAGCTIYFSLNRLFHSRIQSDAIDFLRKRSEK